MATWPQLHRWHCVQSTRCREGVREYATTPNKAFLLIDAGRSEGREYIELLKRAMDISDISLWLTLNLISFRLFNNNLGYFWYYVNQVRGTAGVQSLWREVQLSCGFYSLKTALLLLRDAGKDQTLRETKRWQIASLTPGNHFRRRTMQL